MSQGEPAPFPKRYDPGAAERRLQRSWQKEGIYHFEPHRSAPVFSIDTPPPTVSGELHLGHVYSYSQADFIARFWRMNGFNVFYPMGFDDNGLPTERLVERSAGIHADEVGRNAFIEKCLQVSEEAEVEYERLWRRMAISIDWRYTYRTIDELSRRTSQWSFIDLYRKGLVYHQEAPTIWCPECGTAIAQADLNDLDRESVFYTLAFSLEGEERLAIATTRPELLPACVAVFVHPEDERTRHLAGRSVRVPIFGQEVPLLADDAVDPDIGTGVVMCCTFGDAVDIEWWRRYQLPLRVVLDGNGRLNGMADKYIGLTPIEARHQIVKELNERGLLLDHRQFIQSVRIHERCDTPIEYLVTGQWFIQVLKFKDELLRAGEQVIWHPDHMHVRYRDWVENLQWDWCISRQRTFGVPFPLWYCNDCGEVILADDSQLPVDPRESLPGEPCVCGGTSFTPEEDVMDTWATSSLTPQIVGRWLIDDQFYAQVFPMSFRPQSHEIIRTWAFYTIVKSLHHFGVVPWKVAAISGWGLSPRGVGKISKSRGGGPMTPLEMIKLYSADAVRYWAASTGLGKDSIINQEKIQAGAKLVTKLWNVARFSQRFLTDYVPPALTPPILATDRWILSRLQHTLKLATEAYNNYDYATAKSVTETFFWTDLADNYIELVKQRLYDEPGEALDGARFALYHVLLITIKLLAPILPHVTEVIYLLLFADIEEQKSIHLSSWPKGEPSWKDGVAEEVGAILVGMTKAVRRKKSEQHLSLATELSKLQVVVEDPDLVHQISEVAIDLMSATRAREVELVDHLDPTLEELLSEGNIKVAVEFDRSDD